MKKLLICVLTLCLLTGCGGEVVPERQPLVEPSVEGESPAPVQPVLPQQPAEQETVDDPTQGGTVVPDDSQSAQPEAPVQGEAEPPQEPVQPVEPQPVVPEPVPPQEQQPTQTELTCSLEIRCDKLIGNGNLDPDKVELVPEDGSLFLVTDVVFFEGESVFRHLCITAPTSRASAICTPMTPVTFPAGCTASTGPFPTTAAASMWCRPGMSLSGTIPATWGPTWGRRTPAETISKSGAVRRLQSLGLPWRAASSLCTREPHKEWRI